MTSDESYYSSDSYSDKKQNSPNLLKKFMPVPPKNQILYSSNDKNSTPIIRKRPIPGLSKSKKTTILTNKQAPLAHNFISSALKKKILLPTDSESSYYYDYESESDNEVFQPQNKLSNPKKLTKKTLKQQGQNDSKTLPSKQITAQPIITNFDDTEYLDDQLDSNFSSENHDFFIYEPEYVETNEEPEFKLSKQTLNLMKLIQSSPQLNNENSDSSNITNVNTKDKLSFKMICTKSQFSNFTFQFYSNNQCIINASSSNIRKSVTFNVPDHFEKENITIGTMSISKNKRQFNLNCNGKEVMSVDVSAIKEPFVYNNYFNINLMNSDTNEIKMTLKTLLPKEKPGQKYTKKSIKKIVLINNEIKLMMIKRIGEDQLKIDASSLIKDDLIIFAIGVATWISTH